METTKPQEIAIPVILQNLPNETVVSAVSGEVRWIGKLEKRQSQYGESVSQTIMLCVPGSGKEDAFSSIFCSLRDHPLINDTARGTILRIESVHTKSHGLTGIKVNEYVSKSGASKGKTIKQLNITACAKLIWPMAQPTDESQSVCGAEPYPPKEPPAYSPCAANPQPPVVSPPPQAQYQAPPPVYKGQGDTVATVKASKVRIARVAAAFGACLDAADYVWKKFVESRPDMVIDYTSQLNATAATIFINVFGKEMLANNPEYPVKLWGEALAAAAPKEEVPATPPAPPMEAPKPPLNTTPPGIGDDKLPF